MIRVLTGENWFMVQRELHSVVDGFIAEHTDMAYESIDAQETSLDRIREALQSLPFLSPKKLVVIKQGSANKDFTEQLEVIIPTIPDETDVLIVESKLDKRTGYFKLLKKQQFDDFVALDPIGLSRWVVDEVSQYGGTISQSDAKLLVDRVGSDQLRLANEIKKLVTYNLHLSRQTIELLTDKTPQSSIFDLIDAAFAGNKKRALELYQEQRSLKVEPQQILAMIGWQLHSLTLVKAAGQRDDAEIAKAAKLNPYVVRKTRGLAAKKSMAQIKDLVQNALEVDVLLKSKPVDADEALQNLILSL